MEGKPRILIFDIETSPAIVASWVTKQRAYWNATKVIHDWRMLTFAYKWFGGKTTYVKGLPDYPSYRKKGWPQEDKELTKELWELFKEADLIIGHNGDQFDIKKSNARFIKHGFKPPPASRTIDTLKVARKHFKFDSNKLDDLGEYLGVGRKERTGGYDLWDDCMAGKESAWDKMKRYNKQDVVLLEKVYLELRPWMTNHPNLNIMAGVHHTCPTCMSENLAKAGFAFTQATKFQKWNCKDCGAMSRSRLSTNVLRP